MMNNLIYKIMAFSLCVGLFMNGSSLGSVKAGVKESTEIQYSNIEARGIWHRPNASGRETDLDGICSVLDEMASSGINMVFVETFYHGMTVFKTNIVPYYSGFEEYDYGEYPDYLTAFATEANKRGIEVHAWVESFYLGVSENTPLVKYFPDWLLLNEKGSIRHTTEGANLGGYIFFDPANKDARAYLLRFYEELLRRVPYISGLNLDYIRYPVSDFYAGTDSGYTKDAMTEFSEKYGLSVNDSSQYQAFKKEISNKSLVDEWISYRADQVTAFVGEVAEMVSREHPSSIISVAVHPDISGAYNQKKQDFIAWVENGYIDVVTPMVYYYDAGSISSALVKMLSKFDGVYCYGGLYTTYHDQSTSELGSHIGASISAGADGFVLFESAKTFFNPSHDYAKFLSDKYGNSAPSALPHWSSERLIEATASVIVNELIENGADREAVEKVAKKMQSIAEIGEGSEESIDTVIAELSALRDSGLSEYVGAEHDSRVSATLDQLIEYVEVRAKRLSFRGYVEEIEPPTDGDDESDTPNDDGEDAPDTPTLDDSEPRNFWDVLKTAFDTIVDWFRSLFTKTVKR